MPRYSRDFRESVLAAYDVRDETQVEFCRAHGIAHGTLKSWLDSRSRGVERFVEVRTQELHAGGVTMQLGEHALRFEHLPPTRWLADLLTQLS